MYNGHTDPVEHVSQFKQKMAVHSQDEALLCTVFPSSLGPMPMRWFDGLKTNSISFFKKLTQSFCSRFVTCSKVPQPLDSLLSMTMREGESVKAYAERYWEMFNEIDGDFDEVVIRTFKVGLPPEHGLRKSLTGKPVSSLRQLMDQADKYKRIEDDQQLGKGKAKVVPQERRDFRSDRYNNNRPRRDYAEQPGSNNNQVVGTVFREPLHQVLEKVKNESFKYWKKSRTNLSSNGPTRWWEILKSETVTSIINIIGIMAIQQRIAGVCGTTWTNLSEKAN